MCHEHELVLCYESNNGAEVNIVKLDYFSELKESKFNCSLEIEIRIKMNIFIMLVILLALVVDLVVSRGNKISGYRCKNSINYRSIELLCDENNNGDTVHYTSFACSQNYSISEVKRISLDCSMSHVGTYFQGYADLKSLNLSNIDLLTLEQNNFMGLTSLIDIDVSHNKLTGIPSNIFAHNGKLWYADFSYNQIGEIGLLAFAGATNMERFDISHNFLKIISPNVLVNHVNLWYANFSYNQITEIDSLAFAGVTKLEKLDVSHNLLTSIPSNVFANNKELEDIDFSHNQINEIDSLAFIGARKLKFIDITYNILEMIPSNVFENTGELIIADFSYNEISEIDPNAYAGSTNLKFIDISHNFLRTIPPNVFANLRKMEFLHLDGNSLREVGNLREMHFPKLKMLSISMNKFNCTYLSSIRESCGEQIDVYINENAEKAIADCHGRSTNNTEEFATGINKIKKASTSLLKMGSISHQSKIGNNRNHQNGMNATEFLGSIPKQRHVVVYDSQNTTTGKTSKPSSLYNITINKSHNFTVLFRVMFN